MLEIITFEIFLYSNFITEASGEYSDIATDKLNFEIEIIVCRLVISEVDYFINLTNHNRF